MTSLKKKLTARQAFICRDCGFIAKAAERRVSGPDLNQHAAVLAAVKDGPPVAAEGAAILDRGCARRQVARAGRDEGMASAEQRNEL